MNNSPCHNRVISKMYFYFHSQRSGLKATVATASNNIIYWKSKIRFRWFQKNCFVMFCSFLLGEIAFSQNVNKLRRMGDEPE